MRLHIGKAVLRSLAAVALVAVFGTHQAFAAGWSENLNCAYGAPGAAGFNGTSPAGQDGQATFTWYLCSRGQGCGTQVDKESRASGTQYYSDSYSPPPTAYITSVSIGFNGSFSTTPSANC